MNFISYGGNSTQIGGALPWGGNSIAGFASGNPGAIAANYQSAYNNALAMNQSNYNNILAGYKQALASQTTAQQAIASGYTTLYNDVLAKISGLGSARAAEIRDEAKRATGTSTQALVDRGLGNTTIRDTVARGITSDMERRLIENDESVRGQQAGYMSQLGLSGLSNAVRAYDANTALQGRQLDWMNSVNARYPDMGAYTSAIMAAGRGAGGGGGGYGGAVMAPPRLGYVPGGFPGYAPNYSVPSGGGYGGSWLQDQYRVPQMSDSYASMFGSGGGGYADTGNGFWSDTANAVAAGSLYGWDNPGNAAADTGLYDFASGAVGGAADAGGYSDSSWFDW